MSRPCVVALTCGGGDCDRCGWNPEVIRDRKDRIRRGGMKKRITKGGREIHVLTVPPQRYMSATDTGTRAELIRAQMQALLNDHTTDTVLVKTNDPPDTMPMEIANSVRKCIAKAGYSLIMRCMVRQNKVWLVWTGG